MDAITRAEQLKQRGNEYFQKGKINAAIDMYTEAICLDPKQTTFYSNRALCHSKLENWSNCQEDSQKAIDLDAQNVKALYLIALSYKMLAKYDKAIEFFQKALQKAVQNSKTKTFQEEIWIEWRRTKKQKWFQLKQQEQNKNTQAKQLIQYVFEKHASTSSTTNTNMDADEILAYVHHVVESHEKNQFDMHHTRIPEYFICPVSMDLMIDPVTTPNGVSYERKCIEEHLQANGPVDPLTRKKLTREMLYPNNGLRAAIQDFLDQNPWAFEAEI